MRRLWLPLLAVVLSAWSLGEPTSPNTTFDLEQISQNPPLITLSPYYYTTIEFPAPISRVTSARGDLIDALVNNNTLFLRAKRPAGYADLWVTLDEDTVVFHLEVDYSLNKPQKYVVEATPPNTSQPQDAVSNQQPTPPAEAAKDAPDQDSPQQQLQEPASSKVETTYTTEDVLAIIQAKKAARSNNPTTPVATASATQTSTNDSQPNDTPSTPTSTTATQDTAPQPVPEQPPVAASDTSTEAVKAEPPSTAPDPQLQVIEVLSQLKTREKLTQREGLPLGVLAAVESDQINDVLIIRFHIANQTPDLVIDADAGDIVILDGTGKNLPFVLQRETTGQFPTLIGPGEHQSGILFLKEHFTEPVLFRWAFSIPGWEGQFYLEQVLVESAQPQPPQNNP